MTYTPAILTLLFLTLITTTHAQPLGHARETPTPKTLGSVYVSAGPNLITYKGPTPAGSLTPIATNRLTSAGVGVYNPAKKLYYLNTQLADHDHPKKRSPAIATFVRADDGTLTPVHTAASGMSAGFLGLDSRMRFLAGNNYGKGQAATWKLDADGVYRGENPVTLLNLERCAHAAVFSPDNDTLFVPATCANKIFQLSFDRDTGVLKNTPHANAPTQDGSAQQPRHLLFHPFLPLAYATHERLLPGAGVWSHNHKTDTLTCVQNILAVDPAPEHSEGMTTAQLRLTPDATFLYVSCRDITARTNKTPPGDPTRDAIALFETHPRTGRLTFIKRFPCERIPRAIAITPSGSHLIVSGQGDNKLGVYTIDNETGHLKRVFQTDLPARPSWVQSL